MSGSGTDDVLSNHHGFSVICVKACSPRYLCVVTVLKSVENMAAADLQVLLNRSADSLRASEWALGQMAEPLSDAGDTLQQASGPQSQESERVCVCVFTLTADSR